MASSSQSGKRMIAAGRLRSFISKDKRIAVLLVFSCLAIPAWAAQPIAASVKTVQGSSVIVRGTETIPVREGMHLLASDLLQTSTDGRLGIIFQDGTRISLGPRTDVKIDRFVFQPASEKFDFMLRLVRGVLVYISGKISQLSPGSVSVETPTCVIGLRGTYFAISIDEP
jgi:hypothetical protein